MEAFSPVAQLAQDLLIAIAEPVTRPLHIYEFKLTEYSLYAAVSVGIDTDSIVAGLDKFSKTTLSPKLIDLIRSFTKSYGKVKLLTINNSYYLEFDQSVRSELLGDAVLSQAFDSLQVPPQILLSAQAKKNVDIQAEKNIDIQSDKNVHVQSDKSSAMQTDKNAHIDLFNLFEDADFPPLTTQDMCEIEQIELLNSGVFENPSNDLSIPTSNLSDPGLPPPTDTPKLFYHIKSSHLSIVKKRCSELGYPLIEEYDFSEDQETAVLPIALKPKANLRSYQVKALEQMFGNGRARSGDIC
jgi:DNA excision repair protein ERCC-3